jgi:hypothetical protein
LEQKLCPFRIKTGEIDVSFTYTVSYPEKTKVFLFGGERPPNKKFSPRSRRLCGENPIFDKWEEN